MISYSKIWGGGGLGVTRCIAGCPRGLYQERKQGVGQLLRIGALCRPALWPRPQLDFERNELPPLGESVEKSYCDGYMAAGSLAGDQNVVVL